MAYQNVSFSAGETLTATKMNQMAANDAAFHDGTGIADGAITADKIDFATFAAPRMIINATHPSGLTTNNSILKMTNIDSLFEATSCSAEVDTSGRVKLTLPNTGTYIVKATFQAWIGANTNDYLRFQIRKLSGSTTTTFADGMAYKGGAWGHFALSGEISVANNDLIFVYLNSNGNNYSDGNISPTNTHIMIDVYQVS